MEKGLIISIQTYSQETTAELALRCKNARAIGIRTDQPLNLDIEIIGLKKLENKDYYITTSRDAICSVAKWTNNIAIDSRKGNQELEYLYSLCHVMNLKIIADIQKKEDIENILNMCEIKKINKPYMFATTFSFFNKDKFKIISDIKKMCDIPIIAEGGYKSFGEIKKAFDMGVNNVCIGKLITGIYENSKEIVDNINFCVLNKPTFEGTDYEDDNIGHSL